MMAMYDVLARVDGVSVSAVPALSVAGVSHSYGRHVALDDVSFAVPAGRFTALLGLNGAGKTTLFSLVTRLFHTRVGSISVLGHRVDKEPTQALRRLGVVFQARTLDLDLTVRDNLLYHASLHGIAGREARSRVARVLDWVDLERYARTAARRLSGGEARRVEIARSLLHDPQLLLLDEPTVGLDVASKRAIVDRVRGLVERRDVAVLWATHLLDEVEPSDTVVVLHKGKLLASGAAHEIVASRGTADIRSAFVALTGEAP